MKSGEEFLMSQNNIITLLWSTTHHLFQGFIYLPQELLELWQVKADVLLGFQSGGLSPDRKLVHPKLIIRGKACWVFSHLTKYCAFTVVGYTLKKTVNIHQLCKKEGEIKHLRKNLLSGSSQSRMSFYSGLQGGWQGTKKACLPWSHLWVILKCVTQMYLQFLPSELFTMSNIIILKVIIPP